MIISRFNGVWFSIFGISILLVLLFRLLLVNHSRRTRRFFVGFLTIGIMGLWIFYKYGLSRDPDYDFNIWNELPFHICNVCTILAVFAAFLDNELLQAFCFYIGSMAGPVAMTVVYPGFLDIPLISARGLGFWGYHALFWALSISFVPLRLYRPKFKDIPKVIGLLVALCCVFHVVNMALERLSLNPGSDYFFTRGLKGVGFMEKFYEMIPVPVICTFPLLVPMAVTACLMTLPTWLMERRNRQQA